MIEEYKFETENKMYLNEEVGELTIKEGKKGIYVYIGGVNYKIKTGDLIITIGNIKSIYTDIKKGELWIEMEDKIVKGKNKSLRKVIKYTQKDKEEAKRLLNKLKKLT